MDRIIVGLTYGKNPEGKFSAAVVGSKRSMVSDLGIGLCPDYRPPPDHRLLEASHHKAREAEAMRHLLLPLQNLARGHHSFVQLPW